MPIMMLICVTPPATTPGMPSVMSRRTPSVMRGRMQPEPEIVAPQAVDEQPELQQASDEHADRLHHAALGLVVIAEPKPTKIAIASVRLRTIETDELSTNLPNELSTPEEERDERHAKQVRERDLRQQHREVELLRIGR